MTAGVVLPLVMSSGQGHRRSRNCRRSFAVINLSVVVTHCVSPFYPASAAVSSVPMRSDGAVMS